MFRGHKLKIEADVASREPPKLFRPQKRKFLALFCFLLFSSPSARTLVKKKERREKKKRGERRSKPRGSVYFEAKMETVKRTDEYECIQAHTWLTPEHASKPPLWSFPRGKLDLSGPTPGFRSNKQRSLLYFSMEYLPLLWKIRQIVQ